MDELKHNWGLQEFYLKDVTLHREASSINTTDYRLDMEWFPPGAEMEDDLNPLGTVAVDVNITYGFITSFIIVESNDLRQNPPKLSGTRLHDVVTWIELQTGLKNNSDFQFKRQNIDNGCTEYYFTSIFQGKKVSPGGYIEVKVNEAGSIVFYSLSGFFHTLYPEISINPTISQPIHQLEKVKEEHVVLFGLLDESQYRLLYGVEEDFIEVEREEIILQWKQEDPIQKITNSKTEVWKLWETFLESQTISEEEIELNIPHPDTIHITSDEKAGLIQAITNYMHTHRPEESGTWKMENIERQYGLVYADVVPIDSADRFIDKFKFLYDTNNHEIVQVLDKREMFSRIMEIPKLEVNVSKAEAVAILDKDIFIETYFVYDQERNELREMHWIDCHVFVDAMTGETERM